ncbi:MAG: single-stranded DNA-binding protein [Candidatus Nitrosopolaris sp.]
MNLNRVIVTGRLTRDIELKELKEDMKVAKFTLALDIYSKKEKETLFIDINIWNNLALRCAAVLKKGSHVLVEGKLKMEKWVEKDTAKERTKIIITGDNVIFLDPKELEMQDAPRAEGPNPTVHIDVLDMQLPF